MSGTCGPRHIGEDCHLQHAQFLYKVSGGPPERLPSVEGGLRRPDDLLTLAAVSSIGLYVCANYSQAKPLGQLHHVRQIAAIGGGAEFGGVASNATLMGTT